MTGKLYVCATPIGNMEDITLRAIKVLADVDVIAAEDTRRTRKLLSRHDIKGKLVSYYEANERKQVPYLVSELRAGRTMALVTDSGTPGISDPGYRLVQACIREGVPIEVVPGPSAVIAALAASGLPTDRFAFEGFLPKKEGDRHRRLAEIARDPRTLVFFEAPQRVIPTLREIAEELGDREACLLRELTKIHEEIVRGPITELIERLQGRELLGECVIVVAGHRDTSGELDEAVAFAEGLVSDGMDRSSAAREAAHEFGVPRRAVYSELVNHSAENGSQA
jgi:16S rRNA (cytidine1402-2'-O)-methyltransferase